MLESGVFDISFCSRKVLLLVETTGQIISGDSRGGQEKIPGRYGGVGGCKNKGKKKISSLKKYFFHHEKSLKMC